jgi:hypothetical protein
MFCIFSEYGNIRQNNQNVNVIMSIFFHKGNADIVWLKGTVMHPKWKFEYETE